MEMRRLVIRLFTWLCITLAANSSMVMAQPTQKLYSVKNGKMMIMLDKRISEASLDSFIQQFDLSELALKRFILNGFSDSLERMGWEIDANTELGCMLTKPLRAFDKLNDPVERIAFTEKNRSLEERFPAISGDVTYGYNNFQHKRPFAEDDSLVTFFLRGHRQAGQVMLAGSFNRWDPGALAMTPTDSGWIAIVKLGRGKYWYKFIIDEEWDIDRDNKLRENDGLGNMNSVFYKSNTRFRLEGFAEAKKVYVAGSFNNWQARELAMARTGNGWELPLYLADGTHTYRFIVDGRWMPDPGNPDQLPNEFNEPNSVLRIGSPTLFRLEGHPDLPEVVLSGSFNEWNRKDLVMKKTDSGWELPYHLGPGNYEFRFASGGNWITDPQPPLVIQPNHTFRLKGFADAKEVFLAGEFNNWSANGYRMRREGDEWIFDVHLHKGKHLYKFIVDGKWIVDPGNSLWEQNKYDTGNSVLWK